MQRWQNTNTFTKCFDFDLESCVTTDSSFSSLNSQTVVERGKERVREGEEREARGGGKRGGTVDLLLPLTVRQLQMCCDIEIIVLESLSRHCRRAHSLAHSYVCIHVYTIS